MSLHETDEPVHPSKSPKKKKPTAQNYAAVFFAKTAVTALIIWALLTWVGGVYVCHSSAAYPMIKDGDLCITDQLSGLQQGDEIVYKADGAVRFGRIIAFGGDSVELLSDYITVNGYVIFEDVVYPTPAAGAQISFPYTVSENCVFVLNDYRSDIADSRTYGSIPLDAVEGRVIFMLRRRGI